MKETLIESLRNQRLIRRGIVYVLGYFIMALGVAFAINADLGITPVSSTPYVISLILGRYPGLLIAMFFCFLILIQFALLRRKFKLISLTQIIPAFLFGYFVDLAIMLLGDFMIPTYAGRLVMLAISTTLVAWSIILVIDANFANLPAMNLSLTITQVMPDHKYLGKFHITKMMTDITYVTIAVILSFIFMGELSGVREGTVITAIFVGRSIPCLRKLTEPVLRKIGLYF
ncbi:MAG: DUF6198 family protein [Oscillospiraceae bacterium]|nr:DUF6198 family protein [Oscillospiraceae bacterium]